MAALRRWMLGWVIAFAWVAPASARGELLEDCNAPAFARTLAPQLPGVPREAAGVWLDGHRIAWAGGEAAGRLRLYASARGRLQTGADGRVRGFDRVVDLQAEEGALWPPAFRYLGRSTVLGLPAATRTQLPELLRAQLLLVREDADGKVVASTGLQTAAALDDVYARAESASDLGSTPTRRGTTFAVWAPTAQRVALCVFGSASGPARMAVAMRRDAASGIWRAGLHGDLRGRYYLYLVDAFVPGLGLVRNRVTDPYSVSLSADSQRSYVARLDDPALQPPGWLQEAPPATVKRPTDLVVYELHVRDFSANDPSVPPAHRGKYLAFTDAGSNGMRHLRALARAGLTDVHLLPVFDFGSVPESGCVTPHPSGPPDGEQQQAAVMAVKDRDCFNWGYDPVHYGAPEGSYATDAGDGARRIIEFREMVQALHRAGLRVGMDVVYNHTFAAGQQRLSVLDRIVPGYYQRLDARGRLETSTCCANTATEHRMMGKLLIDTVLRWALDYKIDSFRFDLMAHQPRALMERLQTRLREATGRNLPLIGEGWNFGEVADGARFVQASQLSLNGTGIGTFNDRLRDAVRGGSAGDGGAALIERQGYINGLYYDRNAASKQGRDELLHAADLVRAGLAGSIRNYPLMLADGRTVALDRLDYNGQPAGYASQPGEVVNYVENHDNLTLFDNDVLKLPRSTSAEDRARVQILGAAIVAFSQGVAYFHAGLDTLRSKSLDRNSFDSGDWFNRLDWSYRDNNFGVGLPPQPSNGSDYALLGPLLADAAIKPAPFDIAWTRDVFRDLLRIRVSSTLFRLRTADDVIARLRFANTGPAAVPTVTVGLLDGRGYPGAGFERVVYLINVDTVTQHVDVPELAGEALRLHPVQAATDAADARARAARFDTKTGTFTVPPRTAVVFVR